MKFLFENMKGHRVIATIPPYVPWIVRSYEHQNAVRLSLDVGGCSLITLLDSSWLHEAYSKEEFLSAFSDIVESVNQMIDRRNDVINLTAITETRLPMLKRLPMPEFDDNELPAWENPLWKGFSACFVWATIMSKLEMSDSEKLAIFSGVTASFPPNGTELHLHETSHFRRDIIERHYSTSIKEIFQSEFNTNMEVRIVE